MPKTAVLRTRACAREAYTMKRRAWYTAKEISKALGMPLYTVRRWIRKGMLKTIPMPPGYSRQHRVSPEAFEAFAAWAMGMATKKWLRGEEKRR